MDKKIFIYSGDLVQFDDETEKIFNFPSQAIKEKETIIGYEITIPEEKFDNFKTILAEMIVSFAMSFYFHKNLEKKMDESKINSIVNNHLAFVQNEYYHTPLTQILLDEYFRINDKFNFTTFIRFNISGLKDEIKHLSDYEYQLGGKLITPEDTFSDDEDGDDNDGEFEEIVYNLKRGYKNKGKNPANDALYVFFQDGIKITNKELKLIDFDFFQGQTDVNIGFKDSSQGADYEEMAMVFLIFAWETFIPKSIVVFNTVPENFKSDVYENIDIFNKKNKKQIKVYNSKDNFPGGHLK